MSSNEGTGKTHGSVTDAALRERVRAAIDHTAFCGAPTAHILNAVLAAIPEPPVRRAEVHGMSVTWSSPNFTVHQFGRDWVTPSAVGIVNYYLTDNIERDAKVLELLALKGDVKPLAAPAPTREVIGHAVIGSEHTSVWVAHSILHEKKGATLAKTLEYAKEWQSGIGGTVIELLRGDVVEAT